MIFGKKEDNVNELEKIDLIELFSSKNIVYTLSKCKWGNLAYHSLLARHASMLEQPLPPFIFDYLKNNVFEDDNFFYQMIPGTLQPARIPKKQPEPEEKKWKTVGKIKELIS